MSLRYHGYASIDLFMPGEFSRTSMVSTYMEPLSVSNVKYEWDRNEEQF
jgi:methionine synthase II (cobalamin-independent)